MVLCGIASYSMVLHGPFVFFRYFSLCLYHCLLVGQASLFITRINCGHSLVSGRLGLFVLPNLLAMINDKMIKPINNYCGRMGKGGTSNAHDYCSVLGQLSTNYGWTQQSPPTMDPALWPAGNLPSSSFGHNIRFSDRQLILAPGEKIFSWSFLESGPFWPCVPLLHDLRIFLFAYYNSTPKIFFQSR